MLAVDNFFVFGKIVNASSNGREPVAVIALSDRYRKSEVVDVSHFSKINSYYGVNLPEGAYQLVAVADLNKDGFYDGSEVVGGRSLSLDRNELPDRVLGDCDIDFKVPFGACEGASFRLPAQRSDELSESVFYPRGTIRSLDDTIFSRRMTALGMYEPALFMEEAQMMFYALEEDVGYKVPVVFVHGIGGSARDFEAIVAKLDRTLYMPWFFYYPSGYDLGQLSEMFFKIFLSGRVIPLGEMPLIIVAHSMGGLVVRDAVNRCAGKEGKTHVKRLITIASPMAGHPDAKMAAKGLIEIPSWQCVAPDSAFMRGLRRKKLPPGLEYHLLYAYGNSSVIKLGENSDGVVPLSSQLCREAQAESTAQYGFNDTHAGILKNKEAIERVVEIIEEVTAPFPEEHMKELVKGGYDVDLGKEYSPIGRHCIKTVGRWMEALDSGAIKPIYPEQTHFVQVCRNEKSPDSDLEKDWLRFIKAYPGRKQ